MGQRRGRVKSRNMYKDPRRKTMEEAGKIECGRWGQIGQGRVVVGGNGDNCNCTTIKKRNGREKSQKTQRSTNRNHLI